MMQMRSAIRLPRKDGVADRIRALPRRKRQVPFFRQIEQEMVLAPILAGHVARYANEAIAAGGDVVAGQLADRGRLSQTGSPIEPLPLVSDLARVQHPFTLSPEAGIAAVAKTLKICAALGKMHIGEVEYKTARSGAISQKHPEFCWIDFFGAAKRISQLV